MLLAATGLSFVLAAWTGVRPIDPGLADPDLRLKATTGVRGTVVNSVGQGVGEVPVELIVLLNDRQSTTGSPETKVAGTTKTDPRGYYVFPQVKQGQYMVLVGGSGWVSVWAPGVADVREATVYEVVSGVVVDPIVVRPEVPAVPNSGTQMGLVVLG